MDDAFDLGEALLADEAKLTIRNPKTGAPTSWVLTIAGPGHKVMAEIKAETARERYAAERAALGGRRAQAEADPVAADQRAVRRLSRRILGWTPVTLQGQPFPYSAENAAQLLTDARYELLGRQVIDFLLSDEAFIASSAKG